MKIGIIGAGNIGSTLTQRFAALGHQVSVANSRGPETLRDLAAHTGASAVSLPQAARDKDLVVVTIPEKNVADLPGDLFADAGDAIIVDTGNYYPPAARWPHRRNRAGHDRKPLGSTTAGSTGDQSVQHHLRQPSARQRPPRR